MPKTRDKIMEQITEVLEDALGVDEDEVTPAATLMGDLGAESIDFLDIVFRLEKAFDIKIEQSEMFPENVLSDSQYVVDGKVTDEGMAELHRRIPHVDLEAFDTSRSVDEVSNMFTVEAVTKFVEAKLN